jgi:uncharacterized membrane protein YfcA
VVAAGFLCGFVNTVAGSGSLITLPLLIFMGLPAPVANGTNRVAIVLQNVVGVYGYHQKKVLDLRHGLRLAVPAVAGALVGARIAVELNEQVMRMVIGVLMVIMLVVVLVRPRRWLEGRPEGVSTAMSWQQALIFFAIGIHGGFIQAGVGIFLLAGLVLGSGYDLVRGNAVKVLIILIFTIFALGVFILHGQVVWSVGLLLAVGTMAGAWTATRMAVKKGAPFVRWILIAVLVVSAFVLLGGPDLLMRLAGFAG